VFDDPVVAFAPRVGQPGGDRQDSWGLPGFDGFGEVVDLGHIIDYRDLFKSLNKAYTDYTSESFEGYEKKDIEGLLEDRVETGPAPSQPRMQDRKDDM